MAVGTKITLPSKISFCSDFTIYYHLKYYKYLTVFTPYGAKTKILEDIDR